MTSLRGIVKRQICLVSLFFLTVLSAKIVFIRNGSSSRLENLNKKIAYKTTLLCSFSYLFKEAGVPGGRVDGIPINVEQQFKRILT